MPSTRNILELLAPAKNLEFGIAAIDHGADAVYIGGPAFGARSAVGNSVADIAQLASYAHRFNARVLVALNTILTDEELDEAELLVHQIHDAGADALIVQDMGLLDLSLPPIQLHASTQTDIRSPAKARFLQDVGFSQIVLARELSLQQIRAVASQTSVALEFFIHGALCVAYSGQCYISHAHTGRSANRGECSQACRLPYSLEGPDGQVITQDKHLLSMKDNNQSENLRALAEAGISSFKIEGRLKDLAYVKNITAHYRLLLDELMEENPGYRRASSGHSHLLFTPRPEKTFNRGTTDYFVQERKTDIGAFDSPKFAGEPIGQVRALGDRHFEVDSSTPIHNGDGLSFYTADGELSGLRVNRAEGNRLFPAEPVPGLTVGTALYRNRDQEFERLLEKKSAERRINVGMELVRINAGLRLTLRDEDGREASAELRQALEPAKDPAKALETLHGHLGKLGSTMFAAREIRLDLDVPCFLPASTINSLRREAVAGLEATRLAAYRRPSRTLPVEPPVSYPENELSYLGNVLNRKARDFYTRHGVQLIADAYEANQEAGAVSLMITKHCLRYSFNLCPKQVKGIRPEPMTLVNGKERLTLRFDCKPCEMHVIGKRKQHRVIQLKSA
ncbi:peptidase U32 family protein [Denitratisoma oestradiolicum]|uniref:Putative peptidase n=1 Tax=Denitratisoma oestradiolicum TaxID=311182 RepID=A0A6S6XQQ7_9PROT|nr:U32 family peptidase [Denitratisoma oestradiolicum]TWO79256.1 protease [Denitratisoma oestradiolicum]CAB1368261.1 putative peptidase [Denitratisoma oestradiolicum]